MQESQKILEAYKTLKQLNTRFGLEEQFYYLKKWARETKADQKTIEQAFENFKLLAYREWKESFLDVDAKDNAPWRRGLE